MSHITAVNSKQHTGIEKRRIPIFVLGGCSLVWGGLSPPEPKPSYVPTNYQ